MPNTDNRKIVFGLRNEENIFANCAELAYLEWAGRRVQQILTTGRGVGAKVKFRFAKTMSEIPHEYVVRTKENDEIYKELFFTIQKKGVIETFWRKEFRYWYPGDGYKYWAMTTDNRESKIINRAKVSE